MPSDPQLNALWRRVLALDHETRFYVGVQALVLSQVRPMTAGVRVLDFDRWSTHESPVHSYCRVEAESGQCR
jgi:hypothetical protein